MIKTFYTQKVPILLLLAFTFLNPAFAYNETAGQNENGIFNPLTNKLQQSEILCYEDSGKNFNEETTSINIYEKLTPSIVSIEANLSDGVSTGTGCVVDGSGVILTSMHVITGAKNIEVTTNNGQNYKAVVVAILKDNNDLALLKINPKNSLIPAKFGDSDHIKVGQKVLTIGNPFGFNGTLTTGIISRIDYQRNKIQTDAAINPGCSGGPLINMKGEIIGINQSIYNPDNNRSNIGIGFAVPINDAKGFIATTLKRIPSKVAQGSEE